MEINFGMEEALYGYDYLNYNENYIVNEDTIDKILNVLEKVEAKELIYIGYANRTLIEILNKADYKVHIIHVFEKTIPLGFYEYQAKFFHEDDFYEGLPKHDLLLIDVPIAIYSDMDKSKLLLFGESDRKLYKNTKNYKYINLAKENDFYLIDRISMYTLN